MQSMGAHEAKAFGRLIRERRKELGMRQEDVVLATGVGRRYLIELESGKPTARLGPALMIARQLGLFPGLTDATSATTASSSGLLPFLEDEA